MVDLWPSGAQEPKATEISMSSTGALLIDNLSVSYRSRDGGPQRQVINNLSVGLQGQNNLAIVGPSGSGKTTLLRVISDTIDRSTAHISCNAINILGETPQILRERHEIGFVFQTNIFFGWQGILSQLLSFASIGNPSVTREEAVDVLTRFGLGSFILSRPQELSGGMLARAAIARALLCKPKVLFLDEAFSGLDESLRLSLSLDVYRHCKSNRIPIIFVTHSSEEAVLLADKVLVLSNKPNGSARIVDIRFSADRSSQIILLEDFLRLRATVRDGVANA